VRSKQEQQPRDDAWPLADVQQQLGHSTPMLTLTVYGAYVSDVKRRRELEKARTSARG